jgi:hypothetical protein
VAGAEFDAISTEAVGEEGGGEGEGGDFEGHSEIVGEAIGEERLGDREERRLIMSHCSGRPDVGMWWMDGLE